MKIYKKIIRNVTVGFTLSFIAANATGQTSSVSNNLFDTDDMITINLKGNVRDLLTSRTDTSAEYSFVLSFMKEDSTEVTLPVQMKTRGHFRRMKENCTYPPLLIQFPKDTNRVNTIFNQQQKLKLVMPCKGNEYVIREWLVYKLYNLITPFSFKARLIKVTLEESKNGKKISPLYGLLLEEEKQMAKRNNMHAVNMKLRPQQIQVNPFLTMAVFQYLVGNTDWSIQYQQNIKFLVADSAAMPIAVPYDFDHSGIVNAPYAHPAKELLMSSIRQRRYRGYCMTDLNVFKSVIAKYQSLREDIYRLYTDNALMDSRSKKSSIQFLDDFFQTIDDEKAWRKDFTYPCDKNGTGNVVIKGLKD